MSKLKGVVLGAGHVNEVGPTGAFVGSAEGRTPGTPAGLSGTTVKDQFRGDGVGIDTRLPPSSGTPYQDCDGNPDQSRRVASQGRSGVSPGAGGVDGNAPEAGASGVMFAGPARQNGYMPNAAATV